MIVNWTKSEAVESELDRITTGDNIPLRWDFKKIKIADIKRLKSSRENSRFTDSLNENHILSLSVAMESGKPFVPAILTADKDILSGNHRVESASLVGDKELMAYVVLNADKKAKELIRRSDNASHGLGLDREELLRQAVYLHNECKVSVTECARQLNLKSDIIESHLKSHKMRTELEKLGVNTGNIHHSALLLLSQFSTEPHVFEELGRTIAASNLTMDQTKVLVDSVKETQNVHDRLSTIKTYRTSIIALPRNATRKTLRNKLLAELVNDKGLYASIMNGRHGLPVPLDDIQFISDQEVIKVTDRLMKLATYFRDAMKAKGISRRRHG